MYLDIGQINAEEAISLGLDVDQPTDPFAALEDDDELPDFQEEDQGGNSEGLSQRDLIEIEKDEREKPSGNDWVRKAHLKYKLKKGLTQGSPVRSNNTLAGQTSSTPLSGLRNLEEYQPQIPSDIVSICEVKEKYHTKLEAKRQRYITILNLSNQTNGDLESALLANSTYKWGSLALKGAYIRSVDKFSQYTALQRRGTSVKRDHLLAMLNHELSNMKGSTKLSLTTYLVAADYYDGQFVRTPVELIKMPENSEAMGIAIEFVNNVYEGGRIDYQKLKENMKVTFSNSMAEDRSSMSHGMQDYLFNDFLVTLVHKGVLIPSVVTVGDNGDSTKNVYFTINQKLLSSEQILEQNTKIFQNRNNIQDDGFYFT